LFIVIAKHNEIGNCLLENLNGNPEYVGTKSILGIMKLGPKYIANFPISILQLGADKEKQKVINSYYLG